MDPDLDPSPCQSSIEDTRPRSAVLIWYLTGVISAIGLGWLAARLNLASIAPIGILSLAMGVALGTVLGAIAAGMQVTCRTRLIVGTTALAILTVLAEHAWLYRDFRRQWYEARANSAEVALFRSELPWSPTEYFARELTPGRAVLWAVDAGLLTSAAISTVLVLRKETSAARVASDAAQSPISDP